MHQPNIFRPVIFAHISELMSYWTTCTIFKDDYSKNFQNMLIDLEEKQLQW
jgi:hypothetical protein